MPSRKMRSAALAALIALGSSSAWAQVKHPEAGDDGTRLYPRFGNPDGTLNCAPKCGVVGPCC